MTLTVFFPGVGYHLDKPLLYYSRKIARNLGFTSIEITFSNLPTGIKGDPVKMRQAFDIAYAQAEQALAEVDFSSYDKVYFIGKSIGTTVAAVYAARHGIDACHIVYTPVPETMQQLTAAEALVFHGNADPWCPDDIVREVCHEKGYRLIEIENANHSLETGDVDMDLDILKTVMRMTEKKLK